MRLRALVATTALALALPAAAEAAYFHGQTVDGPSADIETLGGIDLARDGVGQVVYLKRAGGVPHVFVSLLGDGSPREARQLDVGQPLPSSEPRIAVATRGRALAVWINAGSLWASLRPDGSSDWSAPEQIYSAATGRSASDPQLSMGRSGAAYVTFQTGGDLRVARLVRSTWTLLGDTLDIDRGRHASDASIATSADGTALAAWSEGGQVWARRVVRTRLSQNPAEVSVPSLDGQGAGAADSPSVDIEDDSSYAWVAVRQDFGGVSRVFARRLIGSQFDGPVAIDAGTGGAEAPQLDMTGRGRGLAAIGVRGSQLAIGATLGSDNMWDPAQGIGSGSGIDPRTVAALSENGRGTIAWQSPNPAGPPQLTARHWNARRFEEPFVLSDPALGGVDGVRGIDAAGDSGGNQAVAYVQGAGDTRRIMVAVFDKEPRAVGGGNHDDWDRTRRFRLKWGRVEDDWGQVRYRVEVNGEEVATTTRNAVNVSGLPDGRNVYNVTAIDSRGQAIEGPGRLIYVDLTRPTGEITARRSKAGRPANVTLVASDGEAIAGSGVKSVIVRYGDGTREVIQVPKIGVVEEARLGHRYRRPGRYTVRAQIRDVAGNKKNISGRVVVRR